MSFTPAITGIGAVTPAGWGHEALLRALVGREMPDVGFLERTRGDSVVKTPVRRVPSANGQIPKSARLRRVSPIAKFAAAAAVEALGAERLEASLAGRLRVGVIFSLSNGCVNFSSRFFAEALAEPALASPILFPETVFNAPSSHISAMIGSHAPNDTLLGDASAFFTGLELAIEWLERGDADGCLVIAAEELDWLSAEALRLYSGNFIPSEAAAAIYLEPADGPVRIGRLPAPLPYVSTPREHAARMMRERLAVENDDQTLLIDSRNGIRRFDRAEEHAWHGWRGARWSPKTLLGDCMGAAGAVQTVAAAAALKQGLFRHAAVSCTGPNQQAAGVSLVHSPQHHSGPTANPEPVPA